MYRRLHEFTSPDEYAALLQVVQETAKTFPDIIGVLGVGSLVQPPVTPADFFAPICNTARGLAYERIRNPGRRRAACHKGSDLDIWVCTKDTPASRAAQEKVELSGITLLSELSSGILEWGSVRWHSEKSAAIGQHYKNPEYYSKEFIAANNSSEPWMANAFTALLETNILRQIPGFVDKINQNFSKKIPGDFLEVRAFPESLFHLRPDDTLMPNMQIDRMAFPRIANKQWVGPASSLVLYASENVSIYPFREDGRVLGARIANYIASSEEAILEKSYGSMVIKPDAFRKGQAEVIMAKIVAGVADFGGRIVIQKTLKPVTNQHVERIYPSLNGSDLAEAKEYLVGGEMTILIIESELLLPELFRRINMIKGPRLIDRSYERLLEGRIVDGSLRDLLPIPGEEEQYQALLPTILAKKADPSVRFSKEDYWFYSQNLVHSPDNEDELTALLHLTDFYSLIKGRLL